MTDQPTVRAVDTNVLLRYYLDDISDQAERARLLLESEESLGVTAVAIAEFAWTVCGSHYRRDRAEVARFLVNFLARENVVTIGFHKAEAQAALLACAAPVRAAHFGDALIAACARSQGVSEIYTFDANFDRAGLRALRVP